MGANAQTTVQKFVDGAVLTAAQQNTSAATGVPVFATTVTRDAAFGGANKVLAEGQTCYLESTNVVQYYDGAAWATVGPTAAPTSGLTFITGEPFSAVGSYSLPAGTFSATYQNYRIIITGVSSGTTGLTIRLRVGGVDNSATNYNTQGFSAAGASLAGALTTNAAQWSGMNSLHTTPGAFSMDIYRPFEAVNTLLSMNNMDRSNTSVNIHLFAAAYSAATSFDSMTFTNASGNTTGEYKVYGYSNS